MPGIEESPKIEDMDGVFNESYKNYGINPQSPISSIYAPKDAGT